MIKLKNQEIEVLRFLKEVKQGPRNVNLNDRFFNDDLRYLGCFENLDELGLICFINGDYDLSSLLYGTYWGRILPDGEEALNRTKI